MFLLSHSFKIKIKIANWTKFRVFVGHKMDFCKFHSLNEQIKVNLIDPENIRNIQHFKLLINQNKKRMG